mmetsp:Transcript_26534/g.64116  ORF Transcript_26534/g.64116 Transcript_26534/m.64116 type:complete len:217 (+) Transcript_26534:146-796(+)
MLPLWSLSRLENTLFRSTAFGRLPARVRAFLNLLLEILLSSEKVPNILFISRSANLGVFGSWSSPPMRTFENAFESSLEQVFVAGVRTTLLCFALASSSGVRFSMSTESSSYSSSIGDDVVTGAVVVVVVAEATGSAGSSVVPSSSCEPAADFFEADSLVGSWEVETFVDTSADTSRAFGPAIDLPPNTLRAFSRRSDFLSPVAARKNHFGTETFP